MLPPDMELIDHPRSLRLKQLVDMLPLVKNGIQASIAKKVGCSRQTVHNVLYGKLVVNSETSAKVLAQLEKEMDRPEVKREVNILLQVAGELRGGRPVIINLPTEIFQVMARKLNSAGISYTLETKRGWPNKYLLTPVPAPIPA